MGGCFSNCRHAASLPEPQTLSQHLVPVKAQPEVKGRKLRKTTIDNLLLVSTSSWREKLNALPGRQYSLVSLFIYSSDTSHAVAVHSAGKAAHLVQPGLVLAVSPGSSHALLLEGKKPLIHTQSAPLEPLPPDWFTLEAFEDVDSFLLLPLRRAEQLYGSVLVCVSEGDSCSYTGMCDDDRRDAQASYDMEDLEQLSQYLSVGLMTNATDLEVLQVVANAATLVERSLTLQDAVASLSEAVQACVRISTRLDLECLPAVAFRSCHAAAFFRALPPPNRRPHDVVPFQKVALQQQHQQHALAAGGSRPRPRTLASNNKWLLDDGTGLGPPGGSSCSLVVSSSTLPVGSIVHPEQGLASLEAAPAAAAASAAHLHLHSHLLQRLPNQAGGGLSSSGGGGGVRSRLASLMTQRDSLEATGTQSPRGGLSLPLPPALTPGTKVRATTTLLNQTLLAHHLELLAAATAAASTTTGGGSGGSGARDGSGCISHSNSSHVGREHLGPAAGRVTAMPTGSHVTGAARLLPLSQDAMVNGLAGRGIGCGGSGAGSEAAAAAVAVAAAASSRRQLSSAVVPNCATYLMADERQPYKDILHVQRMLPQARAHSLVMVVGGALERPDVPYRNLSQQVRGPAAAAGAAAPLSSLKLQQQLLQRPARNAAACAGAAATHGSPPAPQLLLAEAAAAAEAVKHSSESGRGGVPSAAAGMGTGMLSSAASNRTTAAGGLLGDALGGQWASSSGGGGGVAAAAAALSNGTAMCLSGSLALYLVSSESVPRVILEQVAEEVRQVLQMLHRPLASALTGPFLSAEWARFAIMVLGKAAAAGGGSAAAAGAGSGGSGLSVSCASVRQSSLLASGVHSACALHPGIIDPSMQSHLSADTTCDDAVSITFDGAANANTGTLSMMISSMRDVLSTVQLERSPDFRPSALEDIYAVRLLKVVGRGGQGMVFQGQMYNTVVAVKIIPSSDDTEAGAAAQQNAAGGGAAAAAAGTPGTPEAAQKLQQRQKRWLVRDALEVAVTSTISHPHIVQVLNFFTDALVVEYSTEHGRYRLMPREDNPGAKGASNTAIVMEYCDAGTLKHAIDNGCFKLQRSVQQSQSQTFGGAAGAGAGDSGGAAAAAAATSLCQHDPPLTHLVSLLTSLLEVASGLRHLHENRLVHCDVKPSNVLLRSCTADVRGWVCKLSDFGCVRLTNAVDPATGRPGFHSLSPVGSLSYMAPESMFRDTFLDSSIDIYSFGVVMWECAMGQLPYSGVPAQQLPSLVRKGLRPSFHHSVPQEYRQLACTCWAQDPRRRPTAAALVQALQRLLTHTFEEADSHDIVLQQQQLQLQQQLLLQPLQVTAHGSPQDSRKPLPPLPPSAVAAAAAADHGSVASPRSARRSESPPLPDVLPPASDAASLRSLTAAAPFSLNSQAPCRASTQQQPAVAAALRAASGQPGAVAVAAAPSACAAERMEAQEACGGGTAAETLIAVATGSGPPRCLADGGPISPPASCS